jgi:hypothetical protein
VTAYPLNKKGVIVESSTLGMIILSMIALFGAAAFCFEHLGTRQSEKKKAK